MIEERAYSDDVIIGEKYEVKYNISDPSEGYIRFDLPLFTSEEGTQVTTATIDKIFDRNVVRFKYDIDGKSYERSQKLSDSVKVNEGEKYQVTYFLENPVRAIIRVNNSR